MRAGKRAAGLGRGVGPLVLAALFAVGSPAAADELEFPLESLQDEAPLFEGLIPGQAVDPEELDGYLGRGVNRRGTLSIQSTSSETSSILSETVNRSTSRTTEAQAASSGSGAVGAARITPGGMIGTRRQAPTAATGATPRAQASSATPRAQPSMTFRSPHGNVLRSPSVRSTVRTGGGF